MTTKPSQYLDWCSDGDPLKIAQPASSLADAGWVGGQPPLAEHMNWLLYMTDQWIQWLDQAAQLGVADGTFTGIRPSSMRMIDGGQWTWNATTGVLAWSSSWALVMPGLPPTSNTVAAGSVTLADGQCGFVVANQPYTTTATLTSGSPTLTSIANIVGLEPGMQVYGTGIPPSTTVISMAGNTATLNNNATASASGVNLVFGFAAALSTFVQSDQNMVVPGNPKVVFARRSGSVCYLGVGGTMRMLDGQARNAYGESTVLRAPAGENLTAGQVVYISPGSDGGRTAGSVYKADASAANGAKRSTPAGIVLATISSGVSATIIPVGQVGILSGLTVGATYYVDPATPGGLTTTAPAASGQYIAKIGVALSATLMALAMTTRTVPLLPAASQAFISSFAKSGIPSGTAATNWTAHHNTASVDLVLFYSGTTLSTINFALSLLAPGSGTLTDAYVDLFTTGTPIGVQLTLISLADDSTPTTIATGYCYSYGGSDPLLSSAALAGSARRFTLATGLSRSVAAGDRFLLTVSVQATNNSVSASCYNARLMVNTSAPNPVAG